MHIDLKEPKQLGENQCLLLVYNTFSKYKGESQPKKIKELIQLTLHKWNKMELQTLFYFILWFGINSSTAPITE